jgi:transcriptional regulator GlxA family with amidase domain
VLGAWSVGFPDDRVTLYSVAREPGPVTSAKGLRVIPDHTWSSAPAADVVVVPGGAGVYPLLEDDAVLAWLRSQRDAGVLVTSVCTGALILAAAGLLAGRPATTWWGRLDRLAELDPTIEVRPDDRFVDSGEIVTAAGVSAGIDMALHLVARLHSVERAREVRRYIQYDPDPPV